MNYRNVVILWKLSGYLGAHSTCQKQKYATNCMIKE
jgi:hypothetical protein